MRSICIFLFLLDAFLSVAQSREAVKMAKETPIIDTHIDFPWRLKSQKAWPAPGYAQYALANPEGDFDYARAKKGGLSAAFMSIYIPASVQQDSEHSRQLADSLIDLVHEIARVHPDKFALAMRADDVLRNFNKGLISLPMGMENGAPIRTKADVAHFHERGIRYVTLTHSRDNHICDSSYDTLHTNAGLSEQGRELVREMNKVGIMIDVSHLTDKAVWDVLEVSKKPVIATHSACRHFTPGYDRNLPDALIKAIAAKGGVIQVPFSYYFLSAESRRFYLDAAARMKELELSPDTPEGRKWMRKELKKSDIGVKAVADHIDHIRRLAGIEHVGLGSDFDGAGLALPPDLADVSMYPNLLDELLRRGYTRDDLRKICYQNVMRVWRESE